MGPFVYTLLVYCTLNLSYMSPMNRLQVSCFQVVVLCCCSCRAEVRLWQKDILFHTNVIPEFESRLLVFFSFSWPYGDGINNRYVTYIKCTLLL
jgi:hypothetical protein